VSPCLGEDSGYLDLLLDDKEAAKEEPEQVEEPLLEKLLDAKEPEQEEPVQEEEGEVRRCRLNRCNTCWNRALETKIT
jgi:hypothetical protein